MQHFQKTESTGLQGTDRFSHTHSPHPKGKVVGGKCCNLTHWWEKVFQYYAVHTTWDLYLSQSGLFSWQVPGCLPHKSLNIGCYIKEVTNQADGERCHRVSILQGRCLSLREPTPSALTSNNPAHTHSTSTCSRAHKNTSTHRYSIHIYIPILTQTCVSIHVQLHTHICVCLYMHKHYTHAC